MIHNRINICTLRKSAPLSLCPPQNLPLMSFFQPECHGPFSETNVSAFICNRFFYKYFYLHPNLEVILKQCEKTVNLFIQ